MALTVEKYEVVSVDRAEVLRYMATPARGSQTSSTRVSTRSWRVASPSRDPRGRGRSSRWPAERRRARACPRSSSPGASLRLEGESIQKHLAGAVAVGVMAVTVGMGVERELRRLSLSDPVAQVIFDAAGTTAVERAADACEASIVAAAHDRGLYTNFRFSPGYGDMPLSAQPVLLATLDAQRKLGITLSKSLLMTPTKSVTGCRRPLW